MTAARPCRLAPTTPFPPALLVKRGQAMIDAVADDRAAIRVRRAGVRARWAALPGWARWVLGLCMIGFADGTGDHVRWMLHGGIHAYAAAYPAVVIQVLLVGLIVADPLTVALAGLVRPAAVWLAAVIMMLDMLANWYGNWSRIAGGRGRLLDTAPWLITAFGLFVLATAPALLHAIRSRRPAATAGGNARAGR